MSKTIIITGATGSIGRNLSDYLASKNYNLILISRSTEKLRELKNSLTKNYDVIIDILPIDFAVDHDYTQMINLFTEKSINGFVLILPKIDPTRECLPSKDKWITLFQKTFVNPLELLKQTIPFFGTNDKAKVVIISGISSVQALPNYAVNNVIRNAWLGQAKTLAMHYGKRRIHFNTLSLGGVLTNSFMNQINLESERTGNSTEEILKARFDNVPLGKYASTDEVSVAIETLLTNFTDHITGMNIICDGGFIRSY